MYHDSGGMAEYQKVRMAVSVRHECICGEYFSCDPLVARKSIVWCGVHAMRIVVQW